MSEFYEVVERPDLESPVLLVHLEGWIDAGLAAQQALHVIEAQAELFTVATFDADALLDHRARRPMMHLVDGQYADLIWPGIEMRAATDQAGTEFLILSGMEPDHRWQAFAASVVDLALEFGTRMVVGLGAYPAPVPHTRASGLATTATSRELADAIGYLGGSVIVPAGVQAAIETRAATAGLPSLGLWAQVPHYAATMPYPPAAMKLVQGVVQLTGLALDASVLADDADSTVERLNELVASNPEHQQMISQLEQQVDALGESNAPTLPSGDELAEELQRYLREQGD